jgi:hypothetical protein
MALKVVLLQQMGKTFDQAPVLRAGQVKLNDLIFQHVFNSLPVIYEEKEHLTAPVKEGLYESIFKLICFNKPRRLTDEWMKDYIDKTNANIPFL